MSILRTENLVKQFRGTCALDGLSLDVPEGSVYALVGPNGAGKTTAIKILMNIHRATSGRAKVLGVDSTKISPREFQQIGYVSENQELPEWMTVEYFLAYLKPFYPKNQPVNIRTTLYFTLYRDRAMVPSHADMKQVSVPGVGYCTSRPTLAGQIRCISPFRVPNLYLSLLHNGRWVQGFPLFFPLHRRLRKMESVRFPGRLRSTPREAWTQ